MNFESPSYDVDSVFITDELDRRPSRVADYQAENRVLIALAEGISSNPETVLQQLVQVAMELTHSDSAGISLLEPGGEQDIFHWAAAAGAWAPFRGGTMPREGSPCGEVIAREAVLLMKNPERSFPALLQAEPGVCEALLAPFYHDGVPVGTLWTIKHNPDEHFEAEDARLIKSLARFASAAHQTVQALHMAEAAGQQAEVRAQQLVALAEISTEFFGTCDIEFMPIYGNAAAMRMVGLTDLDQVKRTPIREYFFPEDWAFITDEFFPRVLREGQGKTEIRFRHFVTGEPVWVVYSLVVLKDEMGRATGLGTVTHDITERKRAEAALRESEARQAFLLELGDALRPLADPAAVQSEACRLIGERLNVDRVAYTEQYGDIFIINRDWTCDAASMIGRYPEATFGEEYKALYLRGEPFVVDDVARDSRLKDTDRQAFEAAGVAAVVGVGLVKAGRLVASFGVISATPRAWTHEEVALVRETAERTWAAVERARAEAELRESEKRFRTLFDSIDEGFVEFEVIMGQDGRALDWQYMACNPAFERLSGLTDMTGRLASEFLPNLEPEWAERFGQVVTTGEAMRFDLPAAQLDRWFEVYVVRPGGEGSRRLMVVYNNVIERKRAEQALRENEARQAFLLKLSDTLRAEPSAEAIANQALRMLAEHMGLDRCYIVTYRLTEDIADFPHQVHDDRLPPIPAQLRLSDFPEMVQVLFDQTLVIDDVVTMEGLSASEVAAFTGLDLRALINATLRKGENHPLWALVAASARARAWTTSEIALVEEVAERTWAAVERARAEAALRDSEERQAFLLELSDALRPLADPAAVQGEACRLLGERLGVDRVAYTEHYGDIFIINRDWARSAASIAGRYPGAAFGDAFTAVYLRGEPFVVNDVARDSRLDDTDRKRFKALWGAALVGVGLIKAGQLVASFGVLGTTARAWTHEEVALVRETAERTWSAVERARAEAALRDSEERFRHFSDASTNVLWIRDAETLEMTFASPAFDKIYGISGPERGGDGRLRSWAQLIEPENRKTVLANFQRVRVGERVEQEFRIRRASDGMMRWIHDTGFPLHDAAGNVRWIAGVGTDMTDVKEATDRQDVLVAELQHRTRNLIAVVGALCERTLKNAASLEDFRTRFRLRLSALSRVQALLSQLATGEKVTFKELLDSELGVYGATDAMAHKFTLQRLADVPLRSGTVQTLALALHELATNAVKYGALAATDGHLFVSWRVAAPVEGDPPCLHVEWRETGVIMPEVGAPATGSGYGRELIERALPYQFGAKTTFELCADGVCCTITVPISQTVSNGVSHGD